jgi:hypothetical protein
MGVYGCEWGWGDFDAENRFHSNHAPQMAALTESVVIPHLSYVEFSAGAA